MTAARPGTLLTRIPAWLGLLAVAAFAALSLSSNAATRFYQWPWFFYWQVLLVTPIAILAGRLLGSRRRLPVFGGWLDAGLVLWAAAGVVSALASPFRWQSLNAALLPVAAVSLGYLELDWIQQESMQSEQRITWLARLMGILMALFAAVSLGSWWFDRVMPRWAAGQPLGDALASRNADPLGHSVYTAGFAVLCVPWLVFLGLANRHWQRWFWLTGAVLASALVPTSASRGGVAALVAVLVCGAVLWLTQAALASNLRLKVVTAALLAAAVLTGLDPRLRNLVLHRHWSRLATESNLQREAMLQAGWLMGCARPLAGFGPGTVSLVYPRFRERLAGGVDDVLEIHNTPAQFWAELGAPGVLALLLMTVGGIQLARGSWQVRAEADRLSRLRSQAVLVALAGYAVMCVFDYQLDVPLFVAVIVTLVVFWRVSVPRRVSSLSSPALPLRAARVAGVFLLATLAVMMRSTLPNLRARQLFAAAADAREAGDIAAFIAGAEKAAATAPWEPFYLNQLGGYFGDQYLQAQDAAERKHARDRARVMLNQALAINPEQDFCHFNLGWLLLPDDPAGAERHFRAAVRLSPRRGGVYLGIGLGLLGRNEKSTAASAFALEWLNDPRAIASPRWDTPPLGALRGDVMTALHRLTGRWLNESMLSPALAQQVRYVVALADWWVDRSAETATLVQFGSSEQRAFFRNLPAVEQRAYVVGEAGVRQTWEELYLAWRNDTIPPNLAAKEPALAAALGRRIKDTPTPFARLLTASAGPEAGLVGHFRSERPGYSVLQRNQDGFPLRDLYVFPENLVVQKYASFLFPPKGYLPERLLLDSINTLSAAPP